MRTTPLAVATLVMLAVGLSSGRRRQGAPLAITHVTIIDGTGAPPTSDMTVVVRGSRIVALGAASATPTPAGARVIDGRGKYVIPGLWDMHVHSSMAGGPAPMLFLANGVTGVRDMGGNFQKVRALRDSIRSGVVPGPRMLISGPIVESARWLRAVRQMQLQGSVPADDDAIDQMRIGVATAADARAAVDSIVTLGADFVKVRTVASREAYLALTGAAKAKGLPLAGHPPTGVTPIEASEAGQRSIEHGFFPPLDSLQPSERQELYRHMVRNGTRVDPTLITGKWYRLTPAAEVAAIMADTLGARYPAMRYTSRSVRANWQWQYDIQKQESPLDHQAISRSAIRDLREMHAAGVKVLVGTDVGAPLVLPGESVHDELQLLVASAGMSPLDAIIAATRNAAEYLGAADSLGTVEAGKLADLVLLDANPLDDISNTRRIAAVIANGRLVDRAQLLSRAAERVSRR